jgi:anti-sigma factor RsiW
MKDSLPPPPSRNTGWTDARLDDALRALHREVLSESVPEPLLQAARAVEGRSARMARWQRWGGMAASVLVAFGIGWLAHAQWQARPGSALSRAPANEFGRAALVAYAVYAPEVRHPVEVAAAQQEHLVQWLSKRLGRPLKVPELGAQGFELVGGRLLPGEDGARAQFMYQDGAGERVTLYIGAVQEPRAGTAADATAFRFSSEGGVASFYWVDQGFGYALSGRLAREKLLALSERVYSQL